MKTTLPSKCVRYAAGPAIFAATLGACSDKQATPRAQWVIEVQTDAPIPLVGDRVLIELLDAKGELACPSCRRDATAARPETTTEHAADWPVSFGVEATARAIYLRTRLYRADHVMPETGQPDPLSCIDNLVKLPPIGDQVMKVYVGLAFDCLGKGAGIPSDAGSSFSTCADLARPLIEPLVASATSPGLSTGSNPLLREVRRKCVAPADQDMVCINGGIFFLGSSLAPVPHSGVEAAPIPERLVGVHSFLLDRVEVTVADFVAFVTDKQVPTCNKQVRCTSTTLPLQGFCRFPQEVPPLPAEPLAPMNCVSWTRAYEYCRWKGKRLPTESEWEYAASNGGRDTRFSWGEDSPSCEVAVLARDFDTTGPTSDVRVCLSDNVVAGPRTLDADFLKTLRDRTMAAPGDKEDRVLDLAGNVAEWTADAFEKYGPNTTCWSDTKSVILLDPHCPGSDKQDRTIRGGSWRDPLQAAWSVNRAHLRPEPVLAAPDVGFRCACDLDVSSGGCVPLNNP